MTLNKAEAVWAIQLIFNGNFLHDQVLVRY